MTLLIAIMLCQLMGKGVEWYIGSAVLWLFLHQGDIERWIKNLNKEKE